MISSKTIKIQHIRCNDCRNNTYCQLQHWPTNRHPRTMGHGYADAANCQRPRIASPQPEPSYQRLPKIGTSRQLEPGGEVLQTNHRMNATATGVFMLTVMNYGAGLRVAGLKYHYMVVLHAGYCRSKNVCSEIRGNYVTH